MSYKLKGAMCILVGLPEGLVATKIGAHSKGKRRRSKYTVFAEIAEADLEVPLHIFTCDPALDGIASGRWDVLLVANAHIS